jgi:hypothetical protein
LWRAERWSRRSGWRNEKVAEEGRGSQRKSGWRNQKVAEVVVAAEEGMAERAESETGRHEAKEKKEAGGGTMTWVVPTGDMPAASTMSCH